MLDGRFVKEIHQGKNLDLHEEKSMGKSDRNKKGWNEDSGCQS